MKTEVPDSRIVVYGLPALDSQRPRVQKADPSYKDCRIGCDELTHGLSSLAAVAAATACTTAAMESAATVESAAEAAVFVDATSKAVVGVPTFKGNSTAVIPGFHSILRSV